MRSETVLAVSLSFGTRKVSLPNPPGVASGDETLQSHLLRQAASLRLSHEDRAGGAMPKVRGQRSGDGGREPPRGRLKKRRRPILARAFYSVVVLGLWGVITKRHVHDVLLASFGDPDAATIALSGAAGLPASPIWRCGARRFTSIWTERTTPSRLRQISCQTK